MLFQKETKTLLNETNIMELSPTEADAIIASGTSVFVPEAVNEYDSGRHRQIQSLLNKLHGK